MDEFTKEILIKIIGLIAIIMILYYGYANDGCTILLLFYLWYN